MGSGGGGGSSGKVDYPEYMKNFHIGFMDPNLATAYPTVGVTLTEAMNTAMTGASPYASFVGVDVNDSYLGSGQVITNFTAPFAYLNTYAGMDFAAIVAAYRTANEIGDFIGDISSKVDQLTAAEGAILEEEIVQVSLPAMKVGYRTANAVMSSAFVIGEAIIRSGKVKQMAKTDAAFRLESFKLEAELRVRNEALCIDYATKAILAKRDIATTAMDFAKLYVGSRNEIDDAEIEVSAKDALWDLKVFQYGGNFLGAISGSSVSTDSGKGSKAGSMMGGTLGGAALGAQLMPANPLMGAGIGAAAGAIAGLF